MRVSESFLSTVTLLAAIAGGTVSLDARVDSDNLCPTGRYLPHECMCSLYYECVAGVLYEKACSAGDKFDVNLKRCVAAKDAVCNHPDEEVYCPSKGNAVIPDKRNCSVYYECENGAKTERVCRDGLSFNEELGICGWPPSIDCQPETRILSREYSGGLECPPKGHGRLPHECLSTSYYECNDGTMIGKVCPDGLIYDRLAGACDDPDAAVSPAPRISCATECSPYGQERIRHETNCSFFYVCTRGVKKLDKCIEGRHFNCYLQACDLPENAGCSPTTMTTTTTTTTTTTPDDAPGPGDCPKCECGIVRYPHANCSMYYECDNGVKKPMQCPKGLYYDRQREICDYSDANCKKPACEEGEKMPHECQCDRYYVCMNGEKVVVRCPPGKHFDADRKVCDDPDKAHCEHAHDTGCIGTCSSTNSTENLPHKDCRKYCKCEQGSSVPVPTDCPNNQIYDPDTGACQFPENVKNPRCDPFPCVSDSLLPHECYCDRYFQCTNGSKILHWCESGTHFDYEIQKCVPCARAHCFASKVPTRLPGCTDSCSSNSIGKNIAHEKCDEYCTCDVCNGQVINRCPPKRFYNPRTGECDRPENVEGLSCPDGPFPCDPGADGNLPHECDCSHYYKCENGTEILKECPKGTKFDYDREICVPPEDAHCYFKNTSAVYRPEGRKSGRGLARSDLPIVRGLVETAENI